MKISIVTPSYNYAPYLAQTLESIHSQHYPELEHIVMDGGSTDGSVDILREYAPKLSYWQSQKDKGMYDAIQQGFERSTGEIMAWLNADDMYLPQTLHLVARIFTEFPQIDWLTTAYPLVMNEQGCIVSASYRRGVSRQGFWRMENLQLEGAYTTGFIMQEGTFWRRRLWEQAGSYLNTDFKLAGDLELWCRFYQHAECVSLYAPLACFRAHAQQKSRQQRQAYLAESVKALEQYGARPYSSLHALFRRLANAGTPSALRPFMARLNGVYPSYRLVYTSSNAQFTYEKYWA